MKVTSDSYENNEIVLGGNSIGTATIKNSPEFFQVLSDSLYSDKILAVCREIMCNAWDAHIASNKTNIPIFINADDNKISIRDFGEGISKEKIKDIYFQYGNSSKINDVNQTGGFGLGSKAPFAYTDIFTVISYNNGIETKYKLIKAGSNEDGNPEIIEVYSKPTLETGLEVIINLKSSYDLQTFIKDIKRIAYFGDILCVLNNDFNSPLKNIGLNKNNSYSIFAKSDYSDLYFDFYRYFDSSLIVIVGNVAYNVSLDKLSYNITHKILEITKDYPFCKFIFKIFEKNITITPSRESIAFTPKTIEIINAELAKNINKFEQDFNKFKKNFINKELLSNFTDIVNGRFSVGKLIVAQLLNYNNTHNKEDNEEMLYNIMLSHYAKHKKNIIKNLIKNNIKLYKYIYKYTKISKFYRKQIYKKSFNTDSFRVSDSIHFKTVFLIKNTDSISSVNLDLNDFKYLDNINYLPYNIIIIKDTNLFNDDIKFNIAKECLAKRGINLVKKEIVKIKKKIDIDAKYIVRVMYSENNEIINEESSFEDITDNDYLISPEDYHLYIKDNFNIEKLLIEKKNFKIFYIINIFGNNKYIPKKLLKNYKNFLNLYEEIILPEINSNPYYLVDLFISLFLKSYNTENKSYLTILFYLFSNKKIWELIFNKNLPYINNSKIFPNIKDLYFKNYSNNIDIKHRFQSIKQYFNNKNFLNKKYLNNLFIECKIINNLTMYLPTKTINNLSNEDFNKLIKIFKKYEITNKNIERKNDEN